MINSLISILLFLLLSSGLIFADQNPSRPNLIIILADDMGYSDLSCYGSEISTPHLDSLAKNGARLTRFQNASMCVVTRASLLTGKWWPKALPTFQKSELLPEALKKEGYRTSLIGKWHLKDHPMDHGFDHFFGFLNGFTNHFKGSASYRLNRAPFTDFGPDFYSSDAFSDRAINFIEKSSEDPFFLYLSYQAPHNPLQAPRTDIMRHRGKYLKGWQATREARFARQKEMGIVQPDSILPAYPKNLPDWDSISPAQHDLEDLRMATYAAMVERMDKGIGKLITSLKKSKKLDNTFILFLSDNGTDSFSVVDKPMLAQGKLPGDRESNWQPGTGWAYASVTPWRLYKISQHAGGVTTGAIAHWPAGFEKKGAIIHEPLHVIDVLPTFLSASGRSPLLPGQSFLPLLKGAPFKRSSPFFFQYMDNRAIRTPEWTLASVDNAPWELFDAQNDPLETQNLAHKNTPIVQKLSQQWDNWWKNQSGKPYKPTPTKSSPHYISQGDQGTGEQYVPSPMPKKLKSHYPVPQ